MTTEKIELEFEAIMKSWEIFKPLTLQERCRVFRWLSDKLLGEIDNGIRQLLTDKHSLESIKRELEKIENKETTDEKP